MRARVQRSGTIYYYYDTGERPRREIPLGSDYVLEFADPDVEMIKEHGQQLQPEGITFGKRKRGAATLVGWTRRLRKLVAAAVGLPCSIDPMFVIHNQAGTPYTASGFKSIWQRLMNEWVEAGHERFTFHDLRAKAITDVIDQGRKASDLTGHRTEAVIARVYDRRATRKAPAVR